MFDSNWIPESLQNACTHKPYIFVHFWESLVNIADAKFKLKIIKTLFDSIWIEIPKLLKNAWKLPGHIMWSAATNHCQSTNLVKIYIPYVTQHIEKYQLSENRIWSYGVQSIVPGLIWDFSYMYKLEFSILTIRVAWWFWWKNSILCENELLKCYWMLIPCPDSKTLREFLSKSTSYWSVMTPLMKWPYFKNTMSNFKYFCTKIELKEQLSEKY